MPKRSHDKTRDYMGLTFRFLGKGFALILSERPGTAAVRFGQPLEALPRHVALLRPTIEPPAPRPNHPIMEAPERAGLEAIEQRLEVGLQNCSVTRYRHRFRSTRWRIP